MFDKHDRNFVIATAAGVAGFVALGGALVLDMTHRTPPPSYGIEQARAAVVIVRPIEGAGHGSGVIVGRNVVLTAAHVVQDVDKVEVEFGDASRGFARVIWRGTIAAPGTGQDFAALYLENPAPAAPARITCRDPMRGEDIEAVGSPGVVSTHLKTWGVSTWGRAMAPLAENAAVWLADLSVSPGNSGGPVLSREGYVLGLVSFLIAHGSGMLGGLSGPTGISAFVHLGAACERLRALGVLGETR